MRGTNQGHSAAQAGQTPSPVDQKWREDWKMDLPRLCGQQRKRRKARMPSSFRLECLGRPTQCFRRHTCANRHRRQQARQIEPHSRKPSGWLDEERESAGLTPAEQQPRGKPEQRHRRRRRWAAMRPAPSSIRAAVPGSGTGESTMACQSSSLIRMAPTIWPY